MSGASEPSRDLEQKRCPFSPVEERDQRGPPTPVRTRPLSGRTSIFKRPWLPVFFSLHLLFTAAFIGLKTEHVLIYTIVLVLWLGNDKSRLFLKTALPFWVFGACFDALRLLPEAWTREIHVADLYRTEKLLFGIEVNGALVTPSEFLTAHATPVLDLPTGVFYLTYLPVFFAFFVYLFWKNLAMAQRLSRCFLLLNLAGIITFQMFPAAPPWYVAYYGLGPADPATPPHPAGMLRFDELLGLPIAQSLYSKSPDVFGALPSLHVANPVLLYLFARHLGRSWGIGALTYALGVAFSALYLNHHYVLDILAGAVYASIAYCLIPAGAAAGSPSPRPANRRLKLLLAPNRWREDRKG